MARRALVGMAIAAALVIGCDAKPPKPETRGSGVTASASGGPPEGALSGERSMRLFGRGVSRQRQIRI